MIRPAPRWPHLDFGELWHYRELLGTFVWRDIKVRYKQTVLGVTWAILVPLFTATVYVIVFGKFANFPSGETPYPTLVYAGLLPMQYFTSSLNGSSISLVSNASLVTKVYFPREILPLSYVLAALGDLLAGSIVLGALLTYYHVPLSGYALYVLPSVAVLGTFALAVSLVLSAVQVRYRDIGIALPLLLQVWMFATPVVYPLSAVPPQWRSFYLLNPMAGVVETFRRGLINHHSPDVAPLAIAAAVSLAILPIAYLYFKRVEATVADVL